MKANPELSGVISEAIGESWMSHATDLLRLTQWEDDPVFAEKVALVKLANKERLAAYVQRTMGQKLNPHSIFDCQVKRIHSYKRQTLNILHIMDLANRLRENPNLEITPRTFIFAGKAAPSFYQAKRTIKLINTVAAMIDADPVLNKKLKVIFLENYRVSLAELIIPAADVSEQISTASKEASGTGNMKFMMNGAVTIGTHDGANIEIMEEVGREYFLALRGDPASQTSLLSTTIQAAMLARRMLDDDGGRPSRGTFGSKLFVFADDLDVTNRLHSQLQDAEGWRADGLFLYADRTV